MSLRAAVAFLTPMGGSRDPSPRAVAWFPVVGAGLGLTLGALWWGARQIWPPGIAAVVVVVADLVLTGILHVDGLVDSADGLLAPMTADDRMDAMADPGAGAFGVVAGAIAVASRVAALAVLDPSLLLLTALWTASRSWMAVGLVALPYARPGGLASAFTGRIPAVGWAGGLVGSAVLAMAWDAGPGLAAWVAAAAGSAAVLWLAVRRIGGYTGDVLGAAAVVGETVGLMVAAARW